MLPTVTAKAKACRSLVYIPDVEEGFHRKKFQTPFVVGGEGKMVSGLQQVYGVIGGHVTAEGARLRSHWISIIMILRVPEKIMRD